jgi:plastocyanin
MRTDIRIPIAILGLLAATACSGDAGKTTPRTPEPPGAAATNASVTPTGKVIVIELYTDEKGNYFKPAKFEAHRGDLLRFTLKSGVHNVNFLPDSNPGKTGLPAASEFLQLPDQTWDYVVSLAPGHYYFQCDPHALLGMIGRLEVEDEK